MVHLIPRSDRPAIAVQSLIGHAPTVVFLPGYASDMAGSKAQAVWDWAHRTGRACLLFDYAGCGQSAGTFADQTLDDWRDDALAAIAARTLPDEPVILVGSSMGGWLMLLVARALGARVVGMIGIAAAPDFTDWDFDLGKRETLARDGMIREASPYGPEPTLYTRAMWESGQRNLLLADSIAIDCPVTLLHGQADPDVPWQLALTLAARLRSSCVRVNLIKDGDHRLSRPQDIALLLGELDRMIERLT
jgi:pimeloyl-ACP methyl ester carboxylesterase